MVEAGANVRKIDVDAKDGIIRIDESPNVGIFHCIFTNDTIDKAIEHFTQDKNIRVKGKFAGNEDRGYSFIVEEIIFVD